jgi:hypothetical protein
VVVTVQITAVRVLFAVPLCLVLPGYAFTASTFARRDLAPAQMLMLTVAMSLSILVTGSLALQLLPGGLRTGSWAVLLVLVVLGGCATAARRRPLTARRPSPARLPRPRLIEAALLVVAGLGVAAAFALAKTPLPARHVVGYTQLWMLPAGSAAQPGVRIGVMSAESESVAYRLEIGAQPTRTSANALASFQFVLGPGQRFERLVPVAASTPRGTLRIVAYLYRQDRPYAIYRHVVIRLGNGVHRSP